MPPQTCPSHLTESVKGIATVRERIRRKCVCRHKAVLLQSTFADPVVVAPFDSGFDRVVLASGRSSARADCEYLNNGVCIFA